MTDFSDVADRTNSARAYKTPEIIEYGTLRDLTLTVANTTVSDGAGNNGVSSKTA